jgi:hypothetical protein
VDAKPLEKELFVDIRARDPDVELDVVEIAPWGKLWAPQTLSEYVRVVQRPTWSTGEPEIWRGQSQAWPLHSGGTRRFRDSPIFHPDRNDPFKLESYVADYERELIEHARLDGHGEIAGRGRTDLEILGLLQHHGAATRLIDFSLNCFIALWFACTDHLSQYGVVVGVDLEHAKQVRRQELIDSAISFHQGPGLHWWRPWGLSPRMPAQAAVLAWSRVLQLRWGSFGYGPDEQARDVPPGAERGPSEVGPGIVGIAVSPDLKKDLIDRWEPVFGYSERWLFPDLDGFARFNSAARLFEPRFFAEPEPLT